MLAKESAEHATTLNAIAGRPASRGTAPEPAASCATSCTASTTDSRRTSASSPACIGATAIAQHHAVIVAGVAGLIADALSMGSSGYLAAKSEHEVYAHEIAMERDEIALMPEIERDELALIYEAKGMDRDSAHALATAGDGGPGADARRAGAGGARHRRAARRRRFARDGSPGSPPRSAR